MKKLAVFLLLALTIAKIAAVLVRGPVAFELDASQYWRLSTTVLSGDLLLLSEPIAYRTPMYPWFLAAIRSVTGAYALMTTVIVQGILTFSSILIAARIATRITKLPSAFALTLLVALPAVSALTFVAATLTETLFLFLLMLNTLAVLDYAKYETSGRATWVGLTFALTLLTRPIVMLIWIPHLIFVLWIHFRRRARVGAHAPHRVRLGRRLGHVVVAGFAVAVLISPWLMRNQFLFGKPFITEFVGRNVWIVTFQDGSGAGLELPAGDASEKLQQRLASVGAENWRHTWTVSKALVASGLSDPQADQLMKQICVDAIAEDRQTFAYKAVRRVVNFWRCTATDLPEQGRADGQFFGQKTWLRLAPPIDWAIEYRCSRYLTFNTLLLAVLGGAILVLIINQPTRPYGIWLGMILAYFALVTGILEIPAYRYRMVLEPLFALVLAAAIAVLLSRRQRPAEVLPA